MTPFIAPCLERTIVVIIRLINRNLVCMFLGMTRNALHNVKCSLLFPFVAEVPYILLDILLEILAMNAVTCFI